MGRYDADHSTDASRESVAYEVDMSPTSIAEEKAMGGWLKTNKPIGGEPRTLDNIAGSDGEDSDG